MSHVKEFRLKTTSFEDFTFVEPIRLALQNENYTVPTPIQAQAIPHLLEGRDLLGCAQTGTGKTAGTKYGIEISDRHYI